MIKFCNSDVRKLIVLSLLTLSVVGCTTTPVEQEGGITGTGNQIDCSQEGNKLKPQCQN